MTEESKPGTGRRPRGRLLIAAVGIALVIGGGSSFITSTVADLTAPSYAVQAAEHKYHAPAAAPAPSALATAPTPAATGRLTINSVGLDAPHLHMTVPSDGTLDPATWWDAYLIDGYGTPGNEASGTVFIAMHSGRGSTQALGNAIVNRDTGMPALAVGAELVVDGVTFRVTGGRVAAKGSLHDEADLWDGSRALVLITCQQYADDRPSQNSLIFAERELAQPQPASGRHPGH